MSSFSSFLSQWPLKQRMVGVLGLLILTGAGIGGWLYLNQENSAPLYRYYSEKTTLFIEVEPTEALAKRMVHWLQVQQDSQSSAKNAALAARPGQAAKAKQSQEEEGAFRRALLDKFNTTFEPHLSMGFWPRAEISGQEKNKSEAANENKTKILTAQLSTPQKTQNSPQTGSSLGNALVILPLKQAMTFPQLVKRFNGKREQFKPFTQNKVTYYVEQTRPLSTADTRTTFAVVNQNLLMANRPAVILELLAHLDSKKESRTDKTVYDHPVNRQYLSLLDKRRDGTFLMNNSAYASQLDAMAGTIPSAIRNRVLLYANVTPVTLGALHVEEKGTESASQVAMNFYMPLHLKALKNDALAKDIQQLYGLKKPLQAAHYLPDTTTFLFDAQGLNRWYEVYQRRLMPASQQSQLKQMGVILSLLQIDFQKDIVGLLSGETAFAATEGKPIPMALLESSEPKQASLNKLLNLLASGKFFPISYREEQIEGITVKSFAPPNTPASVKNQRLSVGTLKHSSHPAMMALSETSQFAPMALLAQGKGGSLASSKTFRSLTRHMPKDLSVLMYSDVSANQKAFEEALSKRHQLSKTLRLQNSQYAWLSSVAAAIWAAPRGNAEDLVQARVVMMINPEKTQR